MKPQIFKTLLTFLGTFVLAATMVADPKENRLPWLTDYEEARQIAAESNRPLLLKFTGSDWCPPCRRLNAEVFETEAMIAYATESIVPVYVDFPRRKKLPAKLAKQNYRLAEEFGVTSYPSVWIVSPAGKPLKKLGYQQGGPKSYIRTIKRVLRDAETQP